MVIVKKWLLTIQKSLSKFQFLNCLIVNKNDLCLRTGRFYLRFGQLPDRLGDGAVGGVGAVFVAAIHIHQMIVLGDDLYHPALVNSAAVAGKIMFLFQSYPSIIQKPMGAKAWDGASNLCASNTGPWGICQLSPLRFT